MLIKHLSIAAKNPERVARALAALTEGKVEPFIARGLPPGAAWTCIWDPAKAASELIEFVPEGLMIANDGQGAYFTRAPAPLGYNPTHVLLETQVPLKMIQNVANEFGCKHQFRGNSGGPLYEVWIEEQILIEFVSKEISRILNQES